MKFDAVDISLPAAQSDETLVGAMLEDRYGAFLIFKEASNNIARHAAWLHVVSAHNQFTVEIR